MKVKEIMKPVIKISSNAMVADAAKIMDAKQIGSLIIGDSQSAVGIITERDILKKIVAQGRDPKVTPVKDIMVSPLITTDPEKSIEEANDIMLQNNIRRLPIERNGNIVGIVTIRDVSNSLRYSLGKRLVDEGPRSGY